MYGRRLLCLGALSLSVFALFLGCGQNVAPLSVEVVDVSHVRQSVIVVREINGEYGPGCPTPGSWSVCVDCAGVLTNPPLSVPPMDSGCMLSVTSLRVETSMGSALYTPPAVVPLTSMYSALGSAFFPEGSTGQPLYVNIRLEPGDEPSSGFTIKLAYSDALEAVSEMSLDYTRSTSVTADTVPPPDYSIDLRGIAVWVDAAGIVQMTDGGATLVAYRTPGTGYALVQEDLSGFPAYGRVDAAYQKGLQRAIMNRNPTLDAAEFGLQGADLTTPQIRTLIVSNESSSVRSYLIITITFRGP